MLYFKNINYIFKIQWTNLTYMYYNQIISNSRKSGRFKRSAEARTNEIIDTMRLLGNCSNKIIMIIQKRKLIRY